MERLIVGIDPGLRGGMAFLRPDGTLVGAVRMPDTPMDVYAALMDATRGYDAVCYMEKVGFGLPGQSSRATATFARHCGHLEMALLALGVRTNEVTPSKWMKAYPVGKASDYSKTEWKNRLKATAQQLFPSERVTLMTADALLIAEYGRKQEVGL